VTLWASAFVGIRSAGRSLSPEALTLGRLVVCSSVLSIVAVVRREPLPSKRDLAGIAGYGLLWLGVYSVVLNEAERRVDAGTAALVVATGPIVIALLAGLFLGEGFPRKLLLGCAVALGGTAVIGFATSSTSASAGWGAVLCLVAALAYASAVIAQKPIVSRVSGLQVTWLAAVAATIACLPFTPQLEHGLSSAGSGAILWTIYLGVFPTAVGFALWSYALRRTSAGRMGAMTYLVAPIAVVLAWLLLGESPPGLAVAGGALCLGGVVLARG
jgi:drug/metabolite transporter (DMT)-like permease